jgi:restriction endonuclease Mrr
MSIILRRTLVAMEYMYLKVGECVEFIDCRTSTRTSLTLTRTVDVASVRDLYGTVVNEGANRGILVTTASYGPAAYEFAKDKPISLIDGPNLIALLKKYNRTYRIDLEETRRLDR